ncbi:MAG: dephospho-CoA kinase [Lentisphaerae bacterium]|nr:dephospho-CoA kinase [Lentisphaerota bacterium]
MPRSSASWLRLCLTGGLACGKSLVGAFLRRRGVPVIEADDVCHDLLRVGTPQFAKVVAAFGRTILGSDGAIDRGALGARVFGDPAALAQLNALLHPAAQAAIAAWVTARCAEARAGRAALWRGGAVAIIPLVYEVGWESAWDRIICVGAPPAVQRERLRAKGFGVKEIQDRLAAQWPVEEKMKRADYVIFNSGNEECARQQTVQVMQQVENSNGR